MRADKWTPPWTAADELPIWWINVSNPYADWLRDSQGWEPKYVSTWNTADYVAENICRSFRYTNNGNRTVIYGSTPTTDVSIREEEDLDYSFIDDLI